MSALYLPLQHTSNQPRRGVRVHLRVRNLNLGNETSLYLPPHQHMDMMLLTPMNTLPTHFDHVHTSAALPLQPGAFMPPSKRPKLSLQTSALSTTYGSLASATGNKATGMSAATPTTLNTFNNTFDLTIRPSPSSATASPFRSKRATSPLKRSQPYALNLPLGIRPILKNSRLATELRRPSLTASASPRTGRRVFFPAPKKVSFQHIDEEIVTHTYTARHIDLSSSDEDTAISGSGTDTSSWAEISDTTSGTWAATLSSESSEETPGEGDRSRSPRLESRGRRMRERSTSSQRRQKKKRRWEWILDNAEEADGITDQIRAKGMRMSPLEEVESRGLRKLMPWRKSLPWLRRFLCLRHRTQRLPFLVLVKAMCWRWYRSSKASTEQCR